MSILDFFNKHYNQIKHGGVDVLKKKIFSFSFSFFIEYILALFVYLLIKIIKPFILIRFSLIRSDAMGELTVSTELYFAEKKLNINVPKRRYLDLFVRKKKICNYYLYEKKKRNLIVLPNYVFECVVNIINFFNDKKHICANYNADRDIYHVFDNVQCNFFFNKIETNKGKFFLKSVGVNENSKFVCVYVRDKAYFGYKPASNYRNSDIDNFIPAIKYLLSENYFVFRMGSKVEKELKINNPNFFDYATNGMRTEFLDIFLGTNCYFCITTGSGFDGIPVSARRPTVLASFAPLNYFWSYNSKNIFIFKHYVNFQSNKKLSIREIFDSGVSQSLNAEEFLLKGVKLEENSSKEILDVTVEMNLRLKQKWKETKKSKYLSDSFFSRLDKYAIGYNQKKLHNQFKCKVGSNFLIKNRYLFE
jgi:putative glycosyltransferase (TIGR04372 family)